MMKWYLETGPEGDVVVSTRVRLARNIADLPFPSHMSGEQTERVKKGVSNALFSVGPDVSDRFAYYDMERFTPARAMSLAERHLISPEFARDREGRALLLSKDEDISIMVNEEDHIRIQAMMPGMQLTKALEQANWYDDLLDGRLRYAFDENLGYLTRCPTNLGTGLRASLMMHLPAITAVGSVQGLSSAVGKLGLVLRGIYGEGSEAKGAFYQVSNQVTLGVTEREAVEKLQGIATQIIAQERNAREALKTHTAQFEDRVFRCLGLLQNARLLSGDEFMALISDVRMGVAEGVIEGVTLEQVGALIVAVQPSTLMAAAGKNLDAEGRDILRAQKVREALKA